MSQQARGRGRPRDADVDRRVLDAAWEILAAHGYAGLNVDDVAERAGAAKTTVYRRWPHKDHLAVAVAARLLGEVPIDDTGDLRADLTTFASALAVNLGRLRQGGLAAELVAVFARRADLGDAARAGFAARHSLLRARLDTARAREGLRADVDADVLIDQLAGPLYYRVLVTGGPVDGGYAGRLVGAVLDGAFTKGGIAR